MGKIKNSELRFFECARKDAEISSFPSFKVGCAIVYQGNIIGSGHNQEKTCPTQKFYNRRYRNFKKGTKEPVDSIHAEIAAIRNIPDCVKEKIDWKKAKVFIYRISPGKPSGHGMARSCPGCMQALKDLGVRKLYYTTDDGMCFEDLTL